MIFRLKPEATYVDFEMEMSRKMGLTL